MRRRKEPTPESPYVTFGIAFNYFDPDQRKMIEHIEKRTNYSEYVKRLVFLDMSGRINELGSVRVQKEESFSELDFAEGLMEGIV